MPNNPPEKAQNSLGPGPADLASAPDHGRKVLASVLAGSAIIIGAAVLFWINHHRNPGGAARPRAGQAVDPALRQKIPQARFTDVTSAAGIRFSHNNGAYGEKLLPETTGGGCAFFDFDNDGYPDILFVNSTWWPWNMPAGKTPTTLAIYHNDGTGRFQDVTAGSGLDVSVYGMGVAVGDYDNDGWVDVFVTAVGGNHLFRNLGGGKFAELTAQAGVGGSTNNGARAALGLTTTTTATLISSCATMSSGPTKSIWTSTTNSPALAGPMDRP